MRKVQTIVTRCLLACLVALPCLALPCLPSGHAGEQTPPTPIRLYFDRPINAGVAPIVVAMADGLFSAEGLSVTTKIANNSPEAIAQVASGAGDLALVDLNALIRFRKEGSPPVKAVFVLFNKAPYAIVARRSRGIHVLAD